MDQEDVNIPYTYFYSAEIVNIKYEEDYIVLLNIPPDEKEEDRNIWRVRADGQIVWKIWGHGTGPYGWTGMAMDGDQLIAYSAYGASRFFVDLETGEANFKEMTF